VHQPAGWHVPGSECYQAMQQPADSITASTGSIAKAASAATAAARADSTHPTPNTARQPTKPLKNRQNKPLCQETHPQASQLHPCCSNSQARLKSTPVCAAARICCLLGTSGHDVPSCGLLPQHTIPGSTGATNRLHTACRLRLKATVTCFTRAACFCLLICLLSSRQQLRGACWALSSSCRLRLRAPSAE
jgi:hypothetical protein